MSADVLALGPIIFSDFSIPERMPFGGSQMLKKHKLIGGERVIDTMGPDDRDLTWSGIFWGDNALAQAQEVDALRALGQPLGLSWGGGSYVVVIESFLPDVQRLPTCVPYCTTCVIAQNNTHGSLGAVAQGVDGLLAADCANAAAIINRAIEERQTEQTILLAGIEQKNTRRVLNVWRRGYAERNCHCSCAF